MDDWGGLLSKKGLRQSFCGICYRVDCICFTVAGGAGVLWGGGTVLTDGKSFKENMIDSNAAAA